jgi:hypothetical protein
MDGIAEISIGSQFLSPTGRTWTVRSITPNGSRFVLTSAGPEGESGAVMDLVAVMRMVRIDDRASVPVVDASDAAEDLNRSAA